jgi:hypothetical protein
MGFQPTQNLNFEWCWLPFSGHMTNYCHVSWRGHASVPKSLAQSRWLLQLSYPGCNSLSHKCLNFWFQLVWMQARVAINQPLRLILKRSKILCGLRLQTWPCCECTDCRDRWCNWPQKENEECSRQMSGYAASSFSSRGQSIWSLLWVYRSPIEPTLLYYNYKMIWWA